MNTKNLVDMHFYRNPEKAKLFIDTCKELGLSMSAVINLLVDEWMESKEVFIEAKLNIIKTKALKGLDKNTTPMLP